MDGGIIAALEEAISQGAKEEGPSESFTLPMNSFERRQLTELKTANDKQLRAMDHEAAAQLFALIPDITLGLQGWAASHPQPDRRNTSVNRGPAARLWTQLRGK